jgi:catechol 2,3-dioxygenase-like lactoylglutathione lyase family enzyme
VSEVVRVQRVSRVVADLDRAAAFYVDGLGFAMVARRRCDTATTAALGIAGDADEAVLRLGEQDIALVRCAVPGRAYPADSRSDDLWFQHLAIVVADIDRAHAHLAGCSGWTAISTGGPQTLPPANGGVRAFKFRDRDSHPLELIWFPPGQGRPVWQGRPADRLFLGIDHSALAVSADDSSLRFYGGLGFRTSSQSLNHGPAQDRLDGLTGCRLRVSGLRPDSTEGMGLELLAYQPPGRPAAAASACDIVTDWVTLEVRPPPAQPVALRDPDGHRLLLTG